MEFFVTSYLVLHNFSCLIVMTKYKIHNIFLCISKPLNIHYFFLVDFFFFILFFIIEFLIFIIFIIDFLFPNIIMIHFYFCIMHKLLKLM